MLSSGIEGYSAKYSLSLSKRNVFCKLGVEAQYSIFTPASEKIEASQTNREHFEQESSSLNTSLYLQTKYSILEKLYLAVGLREYYYSCSDYSRLFVDPRLSIDYKFNNTTGLYLSYDHFTQLYHVLEGLPTGWSLNVTIPASGSISPEACNQFYIGSYWLLGAIQFNVGGYYKSMHQLVSYINTANLFGVSNATWNEEMDSGKGRSIGLEFFVKKNVNRWNWSISYCLSKTDRTFAKINDGLTYPFKFDRKHMLNLDANYILKKKEHKQQSLNLNFIYTSGHHTTLQTGKYLGTPLPYWGQREGAIYVPSEMNTQAYYRQLMSKKNGYTMPNYIRLDIGYQFIWQKEKCDHEFTVSIFNILNRKNPYLYYYKDNQWNQLSIFPIIPSVSYSLMF